MRINFLFDQHCQAPRVCLLRAYRQAALTGTAAVAAMTALTPTAYAQAKDTSKEPQVKKLQASPVAVESRSNVTNQPATSRNASPARKRDEMSDRPAVSLLATLRQGDLRVRSGDMRAASSYYAQAAYAAPLDPVLRLTLGVTLAEQGKSEDAVFQFRKALALAEDDVIAALMLQNALSERGASSEAQDIYQETYRRFARSGKGGLDATTSINRLRATLRQAPDSPVLQLLLGDACQLSEQWAQADAAYLSAIKLAPNWVKPRVNLGLSLLAQNRASDAINTFEEALKLDPKNVQAQLWKGDAQLRSGQNRKALLTFQRVAKVNDVPVTVASQAMTGIGRAYANTRQDTEALNILDVAQKMAPNDPTPSAVIGEINMRNGDVKAAASAYDTALRITRDGGLFAQRPVLYRSLAESLLSAGNINRAEEVLNKALSEEPGQSSLWHRLLAHVSLKKGEPATAKAHLQEALESAPGPYPLETLRAIDAQGLMDTFRAEYVKARELGTKGVSSDSTSSRISITMRSVKDSRGSLQIKALSALANIARYRDDVKEEIALRRELTGLRNDPWDWFLLAEIYDQRQVEPVNARDAYQRALEIQAKQGGLTEAALQWARKRNAALTEPLYKPK